MALGAVPVHLYAQKTHAFVAFAAEHTGAKAVLTDSADLAASGLPCQLLGVPDLTAGGGELWTEERDPVAYMMFTSGTTGRPKAVLTTQENVLFVTRTLIGIAGMRPGDREVVVMPLASTGGLGHVHACLMLGNHARLLPYFFGAMDDDDMRHMLATIEEHGITGFLSTPGMLARLAGEHREAFRQKARGVRYILANVTRMRPELVADLIELLPETRFSTYYGLTEASRSVYQCFNDHPEHHGCAGRPAPGVEVTLASPDPTTGVGEVLLRGGNLMDGYWRQEKSPFSAGGWFPTGDLGSFDGKGFLTIRGRLSDCINVDGLKCFPHEVEEVLAAHPAVAECAVVGVPDATTFEKLGAAVVPRAQADLATLEDDLASFCRRGLEPYKVPARFVFVDALPRAGLGKLARRDLVERLAAEWGDRA
jgi:acyl-CoA synthetase (AMP-forming)/AMP-acid ligase II